MVRAIETCATLVDLEHLVERARALGATGDAQVYVEHPHLASPTDMPRLVVAWTEDRP